MCPAEPCSRNQPRTLDTSPQERKPVQSEATPQATAHACPICACPRRQRQNLTAFLESNSSLNRGRRKQPHCRYYGSPREFTRHKPACSTHDALRRRRALPRLGTSKRENSHHDDARLNPIDDRFRPDAPDRFAPSTTRALPAEPSPTSPNYKIEHPRCLRRHSTRARRHALNSISAT